MLRLPAVWALLFFLLRLVRAAEQGYDDQYQAADDDDGDDGMEAYDDGEWEENAGNTYVAGSYEQGEDYIQYWTDYAILPKRCIV